MPRIPGTVTNSGHSLQSNAGARPRVDFSREVCPSDVPGMRSGDRVGHKIGPFDHIWVLRIGSMHRRCAVLPYFPNKAVATICVLELFVFILGVEYDPYIYFMNLGIIRYS